MTDEQAALIAAATAYGRTPNAQLHDAFDSLDMADSIAALARTLYDDLREMTKRRKESDLLEGLASLSSRLEAAR